MSESPQSETQKDGAGQPEAATSWEPRIVAFICNWCTYTGADLAGTSRMKYPPYVRVIKIPCTGRFDPLFMIKAFERDGTTVSLVYRRNLDATDLAAAREQGEPEQHEVEVVLAREFHAVGRCR